MNSFLKFSCFFFLLPLISHATIHSDTLFTSHKSPITYSTSLDSFGFDSSKVTAKFLSPEGYLFPSSLESDDYHYRLAFREGKKWRSWLTSVGDVEFGSIVCNWKEVNGKGKPELVIWEMDVFGHHCATHAEERTSYTVHIWDLETATCLLEYNYKSSEWYDDMDSHPEDTMGGTFRIAPYKTNDYSDIAISNLSINIHVVSNAHDTTYPRVTEDEFDPKSFYQLPEGNYVYKNGYWIYSDLPMKNHTPILHPPAYHPYWEQFFVLNFDSYLPCFFRHLFN
jgi:hypothetical protein